MTEQTQPTDAEISACILAAKVKCVHPEAVTTIEIARAVLAKWGTPAGAGQPLTDSYVQMVPDKCDRIVWRNHYYHLPLTTPQPTQAQAGAVPLTDEQIEEIAKQFITRVGSHWEHDDAIPDNGRIEDFVRAIEHAHGIKGADHD